ncbi:unnamed protein product, partial [Symbiodinium natans]
MRSWFSWFRAYIQVPHLCFQSSRGRHCADMGPASERPARKLVLHFDVNETIMVGDPAAAVDFGSSLNNIIAKATFVSETGETWHDGSPLDPTLRSGGSVPPLVTGFDTPPGCDRCFYRCRRDPSWPANRLTEPGTPGAIYRPLYEELGESLSWKYEPDEVFAPGGHHFLLPAFFRTLVELGKQGRDFSVVIRTFGTDIPEVARSIGKFAEGAHPGFPFKEERWRSAPEQSHWALRPLERSSPSSPFVLRRYEEYTGIEGLGADLTAPETLKYTEEIEESRIPDFLEAGPVVCVRDDYFYWKGNRYRPQTGKPLWLTLHDDSVQHIFFDDNIHNDPNDSIVGIRARESTADSFRAISGEATRKLEGVFLVKAQPVDAIRDPEYFLRCIRRCEESFDRMREDGSLFPALLVYIPASIVGVLLCCGSLLLYRCLRRSGFCTKLPSPSLPSAVRFRRKEPTPQSSTALAQHLEAVTHRALYGPAEQEVAVSEIRLPATWSSLDPGRNKTQDLPIAKLWERWEEEEHRYLGTSSAEQAQLVGKSGLFDGRSSWSRRIPAPPARGGRQAGDPAHASAIPEDQRLIPPIQKLAMSPKMPSEGESEEAAVQALPWSWEFALYSSEADEVEVPTSNAPTPTANVEESGAASEDRPPANAAVEAAGTALAESEAAPAAAPAPTAAPVEVKLLLQRVEQLEAQLQARLVPLAAAEGGSSTATGQPSEAPRSGRASAPQTPPEAPQAERAPPAQKAAKERASTSSGVRKRVEGAREGAPPDCALQEEEAIFRALPRQSERGVPGVDVLAACAAHADVGAESEAERGRRLWRFQQFTVDETIPPGARSNS